MSEIAYYRVSTSGQTIAAQRSALLGSMIQPFDKEFVDEGVSGSVLARDRPGFAGMLGYIREGDRLHVTAIDRLGRNAMDIHATVRALNDRGVEIIVRGLGSISSSAGRLIVAVLAEIAEMEREAIHERTQAGRDLARKSLAATGRTHRGKTSLGRPRKADPVEVIAWRITNGASLSVTARHFGISAATVKRYLASIVPPPTPVPPAHEYEGAVAVQPITTIRAEIRDVADGRVAGPDVARSVDDVSIDAGPPPLVIDITQKGVETVVPTPAGDEGSEPFVGEVDVPLFPDLPEGRPGGTHQGGAEVGQQAVPFSDAVVKPRRRVTSTHRVKDRRRVGKGVGGHPPTVSVGGIDDEPMLPFDDPQGGFSEKRGG